MPRNTSERTAINRLCESLERMVDVNRSIVFQVLDQQKRVLDRALAVADFGLECKRLEEGTAREGAGGRRIVVHSAVPQNGEAAPDIFIPERSNDPRA